MMINEIIHACPIFEPEVTKYPMETHCILGELGPILLNLVPNI